MSMRRVIVTVWCVLILAGSVFATEKPWHEGRTTRAAFAARGTVTLHLGSGDATVVSNPDAKEIVITTETKSEDKLNDIKADLKVTGSEAEVRVSGPKYFRYHIELPTASHFKIRMSAGDLKIRGVDGDFDLELHAGDCTIELGSAGENFGPVDLSVGAGDLTAGPFAASKSGLFRHFKNTRVSKYRFHAHVGAGDLTVK